MKWRMSWGYWESWVKVDQGGPCTSWGLWEGRNKFERIFSLFWGGFFNELSPKSFHKFLQHPFRKHFLRKFSPKFSPTFFENWNFFENPSSANNPCFPKFLPPDWQPPLNGTLRNFGSANNPCVSKFLKVSIRGGYGIWRFDAFVKPPPI